MTFSISTIIQEPCQNFENSIFFLEEIVLTPRGARNPKIVNQINLQIQFCEPAQFMNQLGLKKTFLILMLNIVSGYEYQCLTNILGIQRKIC